MDKPQAIVAGHICLDIIPMLPAVRRLGDLLAPGKLVNTGPAVVATGGPVSNTGLALHRLGVPVRLAGKVADDMFGRSVLDLLRRQGEHLADGMIVADSGESTSYSVVVSPPGIDRIFLHCPGCNDTFCGADLRDEMLADARLLHFGYPPLMRRMYADGGCELAGMFGRAKARGLTTSLDMAMPDPASPAGAVDWAALLTAVLPGVDIFAPSIEELLYMLDRPRLAALRAGGGRPDGAMLSTLGERLIAMGAAVVAIKLGEHGLYLRTTGDAGRLAAMGACAPGADWLGRELLAPCFAVEVAGTTGAGDCTVAGLLAAVLKGLSVEAAATSAVAVGACNVERPDATSGIIAWDAVQARIAGGWSQHKSALALPGWRHASSSGLWHGPADELAGRQPGG